jgi:hypothetical protein
VGQSKQRKARLGEWYGKPIGPGHPDFVPPKKPEPIRPLVRFGPFDVLGEVVEFQAERVNVYGDRIEVEFGECARDVVWPVSDVEPVQGPLQIGSREFGVVRLDRHTLTGCVFVRVETTQEEPTESKPTNAPIPEERTQEEPLAVRSGPRRPVRGMAFFAAVMGALGASVSMLGPEPEYKPRKKF